MLCSSCSFCKCCWFASTSKLFHVWAKPLHNESPNLFLFYVSGLWHIRYVFLFLVWQNCVSYWFSFSLFDLWWFSRSSSMCHNGHCLHTFFSLSQTYFEHVVMWWLASNQVVFYHPRQLFRRNAILPEVQFLTRNVTGFDKICKLLVLFHPLLQQWYGFTFLFLGHYRLQFGLVQL